MVSFSYDLNVGTPDHRCRLSNDDAYNKSSETYKLFLTHLSHTPTDYDKKCTMFKNESARTLKPCDQGWVFDMNKYGETLSTELSLVCDKFHLRALTQNIYSAGAAGSLLTGLLSDRWGRRKTIYLLVILLVIALNTMQLFLYSPTHKLLVFTICRFFQGFAVTFHQVSLVLLLELTGPNRRVLAANTLAYSFALGQIMLAIVAKQLKDYKLTYWALNLYVLPFVFIYVLIPESPRWLVQQGRIIEARKVIERIFLINRRPLNDRLELFYARLPNDVIAAREAEQKSPTYFNVLKRLCQSKLMRKRCLLLIFVWTVALSVYLGLSSALPAITNEPHEFFIAGAICEMIGLSVCLALASNVERRRLLIVFFVATALASALVPFTYDNQRNVSISFALLGKLTASSCQLLIVVYTTETYPTALRSTGVGLSACIARLVAMIGPQLSATQYSIWFPLPYIVYSLASCLAALAACQLPHMHTPCKLPETVHEVEKQHTPRTSIIPTPIQTFDQRRPSSALIRELGVVKPKSPKPFILSASIPPSRRYSTIVNLSQHENTPSRLPSIRDENENEDEDENINIVKRPLSVLSRINSLPTRLLSIHRRGTSRAVPIQKV
ncbi:unnamed protein product [Rotaria socialis]|uniref:Major facilitator superfamily (MFS) profile domain-containing protein n=1 Tax=Rotaria socialis TaxID=392032 RepID=A0A818B3I7_9BILA|nr:unnamed protein product [Rotaria socialis]CAF3342012.1 unnamed protein product [Rotaria socialis]CAF3411602.1 unnamed protein product [Rotaria socialis]CAF3413928.1 unnamed protein product [Rotaria socialis]CAF3564132.1 unnamed protein product [Rotaria socialis]